MRTPSEVAQLLEIDPDTVEHWSIEFAEHLSRSATPLNGQARRFGECDLRVLAYR